VVLFLVAFSRIFPNIACAHGSSHMSCPPHILKLFLNKSFEDNFEFEECREKLKSYITFSG
jgi:hypothetical protein